MSAGSGAVRMGFAALLVGALVILCYDRVLATYRYPYSGDSASYIDMAESLLREGRLLVTPWDVDPGDVDAVPQPLFPPGYAVLIAALTPLAGGDVRRVALYPGRLAAALLPCLVVLLFYGAAGRGALAGVAALTLLSPGVRDWHFLAYSDVPALAIAIVALGALARGLGFLRPTPHALWWLFGAGLAAGVGYTVRNSGLAVLAVSVVALGFARVRALGPPRAALYWLAGAMPPLAALALYNLDVFGQLQPYDMPQSTRRWPANLGDYALAQLDDLGVPEALLGSSAVLALALLALLAGALALGCWRLRRTPGRQGLLVLLGGYAAAGALLLVASRSRYEWGNFIDNRNVLQYSFAYALGAVVCAESLPSGRMRRIAAGLGVLAIASLLVTAARDLSAARGYQQETWLALSQDAAIMAVARALPKDALVASNAALLFRLGVPRPVRELEVGGDDRSFLGSLAQLRRAAGQRRPTAFLLVCDQWTVGFSACGAGPADVAIAPSCTPIRVRAPRVLLCAVPGGER